LVALRLRARLILTVLATTSIAFAAGTWLAARFFEQRLVEFALRSAEGDADELRVVLEREMVIADHESVGPLVNQIAQASGVRWVGILDANGTVHHSSERASQLVRFPEESDERESLRTWEASRLLHSRTYARPGCNVMRVMVPIANEQRCWRCHGEDHALNGMVIIDRSLDPLHEAAAAGAKRVALGGISALLLVIGALGVVIERTLLLRLGRLGRAAHEFGGGDLTARAKDEGKDEIGDVAREFNSMATRLERAIVALGAQRQQLDELVNGIADGVLLLDLDGKVVTMNLGFAARVHGERREPGGAYRELLREVGVDANAGPLPAERAALSGRLEKELVSVAGGERFEELYAQPLLGPDGHIAGVIEVWRDVTDRKTLEASVEQSERLASLGVLASSIAHEVGNPLASIITAVDGLLTRAASGSAGSAQEIREYLEIVRSQVFRCRSVTERLLSFARVPNGEDTVVDVATAVREVLALVGPQARAQRVACEQRGPPRALVAAPDMLVEQVFLNLVLNALKAMPSGGKLVVEVSTDAAGVSVGFSDTGPGIPDHVRRHLFEPFRRAKRDRSGTGLGLFISHTLVARMGGALDVETRAGEGTRFTVRLRSATELLERLSSDGQEARA
jgi:signal transduction histidine kinase/HAMP domain-containing protein